MPAEPHLPCQELREAYFFHQTGRLHEAAALYRRIIESEPGNPGAMHGLGVILAENGHRHLAIQYFEEAISLNPNEPVFYRSYARLLNEKNETEKALAALQTSLYISPLDTETLTLLAQLCNKVDDRYAAIAAYRQILSLTPHNAEMHTALAQCLFEGGLVEDCLPYFAAAARLLPFQLSAQLSYCDALISSGKPLEARDIISESQSYFPRSAELHLRRGRIELALNEPDNAVLAFERAFTLAPDDLEVLRGYAAGLHAAGDTLSEDRALRKLYHLEAVRQASKK